MIDRSFSTPWDMASQLPIRADIDTETVKSLLLINGGGAVALMALLSALLGKPGFEPLAYAVMAGILIFMVGLAMAVAHNRFRRICSLTYEQHGMSPPKGTFLGRQLNEPTVCYISIKLMWASLVMFIVAGAVVAGVGIYTLDRVESIKATSPLKSTTVRTEDKKKPVQPASKKPLRSKK